MHYTIFSTTQVLLVKAQAYKVSRQAIILVSHDNPARSVCVFGTHTKTS